MSRAEAPGMLCLQDTVLGFLSSFFTCSYGQKNIFCSEMEPLILIFSTAVVGFMHVAACKALFAKEMVGTANFTMLIP